MVWNRPWPNFELESTNVIVSMQYVVGEGWTYLEVDLLKMCSRSVNLKGFSEGHDSLLHTGNVTLEQDEVVLDQTVSNPATKRVDA